MSARKWMRWIGIGIGTAVVVVAAVAWVGTAVAQAATGGRAVTEARGSFGFGLVDMRALLAEALGISVEELETAQQAAQEAAIQQLQDAGHFSEEQAELARAASRLKGYLDGKELAAEALGISVEDLTTAIQEGQTLSDLLEARGIDRATYREDLAAARSSAINQAIEEGVITQEQAEQLQNSPFRGFGPGRGGHGFPGGEFFPRQAPENSSDVNSLFG